MLIVKSNGQTAYSDLLDVLPPFSTILLLEEHFDTYMLPEGRTSRRIAVPDN